MARIKDLVVDCRHPALLARFWAAVLDGYRVATYDAAELARLRSIGATVAADRRTSEHWVTLADPEGNEFCLLW